ncbi:MAG: hypothetical protein U0610_12830 [bacterium]
MSERRALSPASFRAVTGAAFVLAFALVFTSTSFRTVAVPWYEPLARRWVTASHAGTPASPAMDWYGRAALAGGAAVLVAAVTALVARVAGREPGAQAFGPVALAINVGALFWLCAIAYAWTLAHRSLAPTPPMAFEALSTHVDGEGRP